MQIEKPTQPGNYWHYVDGVPTPLGNITIIKIVDTPGVHYFFEKSLNYPLRKTMIRAIMTVPHRDTGENERSCRL